MACVYCSIRKDVFKSRSCDIALAFYLLHCSLSEILHYYVFVEARSDLVKIYSTTTHPLFETWRNFHPVRNGPSLNSTVNSDQSCLFVQRRRFLTSLLLEELIPTFCGVGMKNDRAVFPGYWQIYIHIAWKKQTALYFPIKNCQTYFCALIRTFRGI